MPGTAPDVVALWPDDPVLSVELDPTSTAERAVVHAAGELDMATAPALLRVLTDLARQGCRHVDVDLREVAFCDGSGLAVLLEANRRLAAHGGGMTLHDPCRSLQRILDICDLTLDLQARPEATSPVRVGGGGDEAEGAATARPRLTLLRSSDEPT